MLSPIHISHLVVADSGTDDRTIRFQISAVSKCHDVRPVGIGIAAGCSNNRTVRFQPRRATDRHNIRPVGPIILAVMITARYNNRAVFFHPNRIISKRYERFFLGNLVPQGEAALARIPIIAKIIVSDRRSALVSVGL